MNGLPRITHSQKHWQVVLAELYLGIIYICMLSSSFIKLRKNDS